MINIIRYEGKELTLLENGVRKESDIYACYVIDNDNKVNCLIGKPEYVVNSTETKLVTINKITKYHNTAFSDESPNAYYSEEKKIDILYMPLEE